MYWGFADSNKILCTLTITPISPETMTRKICRYKKGRRGLCQYLRQARAEKGGLNMRHVGIVSDVAAVSKGALGDVCRLSHASDRSSCRTRDLTLDRRNDWYCTIGHEESVRRVIEGCFFLVIRVVLVVLIILIVLIILVIRVVLIILIIRVVLAILFDRFVFERR